MFVSWMTATGSLKIISPSPCPPTTTSITTTSAIISSCPGTMKAPAMSLQS